MTRRARCLVALAFVGAALATSHARADERACIAASETETTLRRAGRLQDALKQLAVCAAPTCSSEVREECVNRIAEVQRALPTVVLGATDEAHNDLAGVRVTLDGAPWLPSLDGRAVAVDPGPHTLTFQASGKAPVERTVVFREGEKDRQLLVVLGAVVAGPATETPVVRSWNGRKTLAVVTGIVGVAGVGVGSAYGLVSRSDWVSSQAECSPGRCPTPQARALAVSDQQSASTSAVVSTVAFGVGAAGLAGAIVLWLTAPTTTPRGPAKGDLELTPIVGAREGGCLVRGTF